MILLLCLCLAEVTKVMSKPAILFTLSIINFWENDLL